jgi:glyoxylase-like metal-dependent hydrolase (beta-lactamase superfamily II)
MKKYIIHPATFKLDGGAMFGIIPKPLWEKKIKPDELNRILMSLRVIYVDMGDKKILIDTGIGEYHNEKFKSQFEVQSIKSPLSTILKSELNIIPSDITDIIITHLHFDHIGGLTEGDGDLAFPNATIHTHAKHFEYAQKPSSRDQGSFHSHIFLPLLENYKKKNQLNLITDNEGVVLTSSEGEIRFKTSFGHTPYMIHPIINNYIYMADLVPMSHHLNIPWVMGYDIEPAVTTLYKEEFYKFIIKHDLIMVFEHDNDNWGATIKHDGKRYSFEKVFESNKKNVQELE